VPTFQGGRPASGQTDAAGKYTLSCFAEKDGAMPGEHNITVTKTKVTGAVGDPTMAGLSGPGAGTIEWVVPQRYSTPDKSGLTVKVEPGMKPFDISLTAK
jgi:hypothetical protein